MYDNIDSSKGGGGGGVLPWFSLEKDKNVLNDTSPSHRCQTFRLLHDNGPDGSLVQLHNF